MNIDELQVGLRVRIPATEVGGGKFHFAYVRDICRSLFSDDKIVIISVPALKIEKVVQAEEIVPVKKEK